MRAAQWGGDEGDEMGVFFLVPMSGGTAVCILAVWLLSRLGWFGWVLLLLVVLWLAIGIGVSVVSDRLRARSQARYEAKFNAALERKRNPVRTAINDCLQACDAIDRGF